MGQKGGKFERELCGVLSSWWSGGKGDDLFWRASQSGGRATTRGRKGKRTRGHCGDVAATDDEGLPLVKCVTLELKRGYPSVHLDDLLDSPLPARPPKETAGKKKKASMMAWINQAMDAAALAESLYWMIIHKHDRREVVCYFPHNFYLDLCVLGCFDRLPMPCASITAWVRRTNGERVRVPLMAMRLDRFLGAVDPGDIRALLRRRYYS